MANFRKYANFNSPAKTVADCFKFRNKIGLDVALEALRERWRKKLVTMDTFWKYARVCRVARLTPLTVNHAQPIIRIGYV